MLGSSNPDTDEISLDYFPHGVPRYLINLSASLMVDDSVVASYGSVGQMGQQLSEFIGLWSPACAWKNVNNQILAGEYQALGLQLQGTSQSELDQVRQELSATKSSLEDGDPSVSMKKSIASIMSATITSYLAQNAIQDTLQAGAANVVVFHAPSFGKFSSNIGVRYLYGIPVKTDFSGLVMDVDHLSIVVASKDNNAKDSVMFLRASGIRASALEHHVPEQMFSTAGSPAKSISTEKALSIASSSGQRIWSVGKNTINAALASIALPYEMETEIRSAVSAGKRVTLHDQPVVYEGGIFYGYTIVDPLTRAGAYKIGEFNGGVLFTRFSAFATMLSISASSGKPSGNGAGNLIAGLLALYEGIDKGLPPKTILVTVLLAVLVSILMILVVGTFLGILVEFASITTATAWNLGAIFGLVVTTYSVLKTLSVNTRIRVYRHGINEESSFKAA